MHFVEDQGSNIHLISVNKNTASPRNGSKEVKRKMQVFLPTDQGNQRENSELSTDVEDVISSIQGDNDKSTIGSMKGVVR